MLNTPERWRIAMSDPFDSPKFDDLKLVTAQDRENSSLDIKAKNESSPKESLPQPTPKKSPTYLKLVVDNSSSPPPPLKKKFSKTLSPSTGFTFKIEEHGQGCYLFVACDPFHHIDDFELLLTIQNDIGEGDLEFDEEGFIREDMEPYLACHFPDINVEKLMDFVCADEMLYATIMVNFQLKVLRELLLFCSEQAISRLVVSVDEDPNEDGHAWHAYDELVKFQDRVPTKNGTQVNLTICSSSRTYDRLVDLMDNIKQEFHQTLWKEHRDNFAMREYLKINPTLQYFD